VRAFTAKLSRARGEVEADQLAPRPLHLVERDDHLSRRDLERRLRVICRGRANAENERDEEEESSFHHWYIRSSRGRSSTFHLLGQIRMMRFGRKPSSNSAGLKRTRKPLFPGPALPLMISIPGPALRSLFWSHVRRFSSATA